MKKLFFAEAQNKRSHLGQVQISKNSTLLMESEIIFLQHMPIVYNIHAQQW